MLQVRIPILRSPTQRLTTGMTPLPRLPSPGQRLFEELWGFLFLVSYAMGGHEPATSHICEEYGEYLESDLRFTCVSGHDLSSWGCWVVRRQRDRNRLWRALHGD